MYMLVMVLKVKEVIDDMQGIIDAVNIDLKCFSNSYYKKS